MNETNPSLWVATTPAGSFPQLESDCTADVAIVGAGITGLSAALMLAREGLDVVVLEAGQVCAGTTGYTTAKLSSLHGLTYSPLQQDHGKDKAQLYGAAAEAAIAWVAELIDQQAIECDFERRPAYTYTQEDARVLDIRAEVDTARDLGLPASLVTESELPFPIKAAVRFENQAMFHPRKYCLGLARLATGQGARIFEMTRAVDIDTGTPAVVQTGRGKVTAQHVIQATQIPIHDPAGFFARTSPTRSYCVALRAGNAGPEGMYLSVDTPGRSIRTHREGSDTYILVGGEGHKVGQDPDTTKRYDTLGAWATQNFGSSEIVFKWSAQDYTSVDGLPYIGKLAPGMDHMWVATGFKKWGMTTGTVAGLLLTDQILDRPNVWSEVFDSTRVKAAASAKKLVKENLNVAKHFVADNLDRLSAPGLESLRPGQAAVVNANGHRVAAYRDATGIVHSVSPVCTHLKCTVDFNTAEKTWDCPCHGSRFDIDGKVLQGPAHKDLDPIDPGTT